MSARVDVDHWTSRFAALATEFEVPGAGLAFWHDGQVYEFATGVLNRATGTPVTKDSLFQIGSITKVWTATQIMLLVEQGRLTLDTPVVDVLPEFRVRDEKATATITVRHLLSHTSGVDGDLFLDTGRGDDCVEKYVTACADLEQIFPVGESHAYCNSGFVIAGRIIERLTGKVWDQALREQICEPLGLTHTWTLPEDALRFGAAMGHLNGEPAPMWGLMRSVGPAGLICARPVDVVAFARAHLTPGALLAAPEVMREPQVDLPNPHTIGAQWGIGWMLNEWDGHLIVGHGGSTLGQDAMLWTVPDTGTVITLLANGGKVREFQFAVMSELLQALVGLTMPTPLGPPDQPVTVDIERHVGVYEREGTRITVTKEDTGLRMVSESLGEFAYLDKPRVIDLTPVDDKTFVGLADGAAIHDVAVFYELRDGTNYVHYGVRATPKKR
ncbi:serine hydrolase domain-containing protein [Embleya sp. NBC_00896]|uniref:serine hydrolase domain-containing protein n=1 Tax=Embleya sp. NBC_00896 TaxID=2975961 RepID=UPI002F90A6E2|nr:beta-lactamase family protein [Embleya sp. NBC_00896]